MLLGRFPTWLDTRVKYYTHTVPYTKQDSEKIHKKHSSHHIHRRKVNAETTAQHHPVRETDCHRVLIFCDYTDRRLNSINNIEPTVHSILLLSHWYIGNKHVKPTSATHACMSRELLTAKGLLPTWQPVILLLHTLPVMYSYKCFKSTQTPKLAGITFPVLNKEKRKH